MIGSGLQALSAFTFLGFPLLGSAASHILLLTAKSLGVLVLVSFVSTRILRFVLR